MHMQVKEVNLWVHVKLPRIAFLSSSFSSILCYFLVFLSHFLFLNRNQPTSTTAPPLVPTGGKVERWEKQVWAWTHAASAPPKRGCFLSVEFWLPVGSHCHCCHHCYEISESPGHERMRDAETLEDPYSLWALEVLCQMTLSSHNQKILLHLCTTGFNSRFEAALDSGWGSYWRKMKYWLDDLVNSAVPLQPTLFRVLKELCHLFCLGFLMEFNWREK
jgi:hypothetical protein